MNSRYLSERSLQALARVGALMCPGVDSMPPFGETGCLARVDEVLAPSHPKDRHDLNRLLWVLSWCPGWLLERLFRWSHHWERRPRWLQPPLRMLDLGLRGVVCTLYYTGPAEEGGNESGRDGSVHAAMGYAIHCVPQTPTRQEGATPCQ